MALDKSSAVNVVIFLSILFTAIYIPIMLILNQKIDAIITFVCYSFLITYSYIFVFFFFVFFYKVFDIYVAPPERERSNLWFYWDIIYILFSTYLGLVFFVTTLVFVGIRGVKGPEFVAFFVILFFIFLIACILLPILFCCLELIFVYYKDYFYEKFKYFYTCNILIEDVLLKIAIAISLVGLHTVIQVIAFAIFRNKNYECQVFILSSTIFLIVYVVICLFITLFKRPKRTYENIIILFFLIFIFLMFTIVNIFTLKNIGCNNKKELFYYFLYPFSSYTSIITHILVAYYTLTI